VNSFKRLVTGAPQSGATWAPVYISYGGNNRTQMIRLPGPGRVEDRSIDGSCNPYLAAAVTLAAGLDGINRELEPGDPNFANMYEMPMETIRERGIERLPATLNDALNELEKDDVILDALGQEYAGAHIRAKREEWNDYHNSVSQWEVDHYLNIH
ncbi:MAG: type III glutamate--ammonia ligase, partial [Candidatus Latescibacteria bacterium]|nr:type III glutamate--ammonia ligase [Candidatus Latescibacterota bacterium]